MENAHAHAAEETEPLAPQRRRVVEAYTVNDKANNMKKYSFWILAFIAFLIFSAGSGSGENKKHKRAKKLRNKAETLPEAEAAAAKTAMAKIEMNEKYAQLNDAHAAYEGDSADDELEAEDELQREVEGAFDGVDMAEEDLIESNYSVLSSAVQTAQENVRFYLDKLFGTDEAFDDDDAMSETSADVQLTEEQLDLIAKKISERLEADAKNAFREKADSVKEEKASEIDMVVAEDRNAEMNARQIMDDVKEARSVVLNDLKDEIANAANQVKNELEGKAKAIENEVVQEVTGKRLEDIEKKKRARKERRQKLKEKFQQLRAEADAKEAWSAKKKGKDGDRGGDKRLRVQKPKVPLSYDDEPKEAESSEEEKPRRRKPDVKDAMRRVKKPKAVLASDDKSKESDPSEEEEKPQRRKKSESEGDDDESEEEEKPRRRKPVKDDEPDDDESESKGDDDESEDE